MLIETFTETMLEVEQFKRNRLKELLNKCNNAQKASFMKYYPEPDKIHQRQLVSAIDLLKRTLSVAK
jgi:hypothetical protein